MFLFIALAVLLVDQASKFFIMNTMFQGLSIPVFPNIFHITYIHNPGAAFGMLANKTSLFVAVSAIVIAGIVFYYIKTGVKRGVMPIAMGFIVGGASGNLIDRVRFGEVIDFIDLRVWPVFNLADTAIIIGAGLLIIVLWKAESKS